MKKQSFLMALSLAISLGSCSSPHQNLAPPVQDAPKTPLVEHKSFHNIRFNVNVPGDFKTQQVAQTNFAKLEVSNGDSLITALGADTEGFIEAQGSTIQLSANVPEGNNWIATIGFYQNKEATPFFEIKTLFHLPVVGNSININLQTHLTGALAEELRALAPERFEQPLEVNAVQRFVNELTGAQVNNNTLSFTRLSGLTPPTPISLAPRLIAMAVVDQDIQFTSEENYSGFSPTNYLPVPHRLGAYTNLAGGKTIGIDQQIAINPFNGNLFFNTTDDPPQSGVQGPVNENLYGLSWNAANKSFSPLFSGQTFQDINSGTLSLGNGNTTGSQQQAAAFFIERTHSGQGFLKAVSQQNGSVIWQHDLGSISESTFTPVLKSLSNCACACDDEHMAIISRRSNTGTYRILALRQERSSYPTPGTCATTPLPEGTQNGHVVWSYPAEGQSDLSAPIQPGGALSRDKQTFYALTREGNSSKLLHINTETGVVMRESSLGDNPVGAPAIGKNGTIYVSTTSLLKGFNPADGTQVFSRAGSASFLSRFGTGPVVDYEDQDIVYAIDTQPTASVSNPTLNAYYGGSNLKKWSTALNLNAPGQIAITGLVLGEETTGERIIYVGLSDNRVYAIRDKGDKGELDWRQFPDGSLWNSHRAFSNSLYNWGGMTHRNNTLFVSTRDGGDGQILGVRALKVSTLGLPSSAPWPKTGGNLANSGLSHLETP